MNDDKLAAYQTLYSALETVAVLAAPIAPFYMDRLFCDLNSATGAHDVISVHMMPMPGSDPACVDTDLEERMALAQKSSSMVLALRRKVNIKVRQPLAQMIIPVLDPKIEEQFEKVRNLVLSEVNVKEVVYIKDTTWSSPACRRRSIPSVCPPGTWSCSPLTMRCPPRTCPEGSWLLRAS